MFVQATLMKYHVFVIWCHARALILFTTHFFFPSLAISFDSEQFECRNTRYTSLLGYVVSFNIYFFAYFISDDACVSGIRVIVAVNSKLSVKFALDM